MHEECYEFDNIEFPWLSDKNVRRCTQEVNDETGESMSYLPLFILNETVLNEKTSQVARGERVLAIKGILSKRDVFSLKSVIKERPGDGVVLWFVNFLMQKDLQSRYNFLHSCLVTGNDERDCAAVNKTRDTNNLNFIVKTF